MSVLEDLIAAFSDSSVIVLGMLVFLATAVTTFGAMLAMRARAAVKRRAAGIAEYSGEAAESRTLQRSSLQAVQRLLDYTTKHYMRSSKDKGDVKVLRRRMIQAGIYDTRAVAFFFIARSAFAVAIAAAVFFSCP
jgi:tight adherence protein C